MKMKKISILLMVAVLLITAQSFTFATSLSVNGELKPANIESKYDRTYISTDTLKAYGLNTLISGNNIKISNKEVTFSFINNSNKVKVNDASMTLDSMAYIKGNVAYVPLKFVFETMNYVVGYSFSNKQVTLKSSTKSQFPLTIVDSGSTYTFTKPAKRIVSLAPSITEILFAIGAGDLLVGRTNYCKYPLETASVKSVGTLYEPDLETIVNLEPDTVIAATHMNEEVLTTLEKAKIATLTQASPAKLSEIYTLIEQLGRLTDKLYESRALVSSMKNKEERINNIMKKIPVSARKEVYYVVGTGKSEYTAGKQTFISEILIGAGCINVATDVDKWSYTLEKLIAHDPEYLIGADYSFATMKDSANYKSLSALKNGKTIIVDTDVFSIPGPRIMDYSMKTIIQKLYPQYASQLQF